MELLGLITKFQYAELIVKSAYTLFCTRVFTVYGPVYSPSS